MNHIKYNYINAYCIYFPGIPETNNTPMSISTYDQVINAALNRYFIVETENGTMPNVGSLTSTRIQQFES